MAVINTEDCLCYITLGLKYKFQKLYYCDISISITIATFNLTVDNYIPTFIKFQ